MQMAIDAIFICFVEDCDMNDGVNKPYFMSMGLMVSLFTQLLGQNSICNDKSATDNDNNPIFISTTLKSIEYPTKDFSLQCIYYYLNT